ncbi:hypothetical protein [Streptomyces sp. NPDC054787]
MQLRRALPLTLATLVLTTGCVTVHPAATPQGARPAPAAARAEPPQPPPGALPLGPLPMSAEQAPAAPGAGPDTEPHGAPDAVPASAFRRPAAAQQPHQPHRPRRTKPARAAQPAAPAAKRAAVAKPRPAPQRPYDMASLCAAARGTVSPSIVALCR